MEYVFSWDTNKANINLKKHKISFEEAKTIFNDPFLLTLPDEEHSETEERFISIGTSTKERILLVVHLEKHETENKSFVRIISCRKATPIERRKYEEKE
ncbi:MAG: hypothetical protein UZ14_CFX002002081 [Chloroflexi bacterium OLB14]|nr:MAG: hypothetical protein UZ14_CFX002002081 [Chloroflexi bacterium OLB14]